MFSMRVEGLNELADELNAMGSRVRRSLLLEMLEESAEPIRALMARYAPYEPGPPDIRDSMIIAKFSKSIGDDGMLGHQDEFQATVAVGPRRGFPYGLLQEYGTVHHGAQPFARPAFDHGAPISVGLMSKSLWLAISQRRMFRPGSLAA